jgi:hypothetical protein
MIYFIRKNRNNFNKKHTNIIEIMITQITIKLF